MRLIGCVLVCLLMHCCVVRSATGAKPAGTLYDACLEHTDGVECLRFCPNCGRHCLPSCTAQEDPSDDEKQLQSSGADLWIAKLEKDQPALGRVMGRLLLAIDFARAWNEGKEYGNKGIMVRLAIKSAATLSGVALGTAITAMTTVANGGDEPMAGVMLGAFYGGLWASQFDEALWKKFKSSWLE